MKLGEALAIRSDLQKRIAQMSNRLQASALVQEGDEPPEQPDTLLVELRHMVGELERLITIINLTNASASLSDGTPLTAALARRDVIGAYQTTLRSLVDSVTQSQARYSRSEIRVTRRIDVGAIRKQLDDLARERRELDIAIQERNWTIDLVDDASR